MAAATDFEGALCKATLELLERDAFLRCWISGRGPAAVLRSSLPASAMARVRALESDGYRVVVSRPECAFAPVFSVFLQREDPPFTAITAAADFDAEGALEHALDEAEGRAAHARDFPAHAPRAGTAVRSPAALHRLYQTRGFFRSADFYALGPTQPFDAGSTCNSWAGLHARLARSGLAVLAFDLTPPDASCRQGRVPLFVARAVVPGLLPIWFAHGLEPAGLAAFRRVARHRTAIPLHPLT
jgi:ribosomal protein S12 methylthiotransferase accessory factor